MKWHTQALLIGVRSPSPIEIGGVEHTFAPALGVDEDIAWYKRLLEENLGNGARIRVLTAPGETRRQSVMDALRQTVRSLSDHGTLYLVLCGHGFRTPDYSGDDRRDGADEVLALSHGDYIKDDDFAEIWRELPSEARLITFADTCSADSLAIAGFNFDEAKQILKFKTPTPEKLSIAASIEGAPAFGEPVRRYGHTAGTGYRGVMSAALEDSWLAIRDRPELTYQDWIREAMILVMARANQTPICRYFGPSGSPLLRSKPFSPKGQ